MSARDQIRRLGRLYGIEPSYTDFWGRRRPVPAATEHALLEAMGAAVGSEQDVADSLREVAARPWRRMLSPVYVIAATEPLEITFSLPAGLGGSRLYWTLAEETGSVHEGTLKPDELPVADTAQVDGDTYCRWRMRLPSELPHGYHRLRVEARTSRAEVEWSSQLIVTPARCHRPPRRQRLWGLTAQLYGVGAAGHGGLGGFTAIARLAEPAAARGAGGGGLNPLHARFPGDGNHRSPY
jgi:hypothetical protein